MIRRGVLIEDRRRLTLAYRWRDRCLTVALWGAWWPPVDAVRHLLASEAFWWSVFVADLAEILTIATGAVGLLLAWGAYDRWRGASARDEGAPVERRQPAPTIPRTLSEPVLDHADIGS